MPKLKTNKQKKQQIYDRQILSVLLSELNIGKKENVKTFLKHLFLQADSTIQNLHTLWRGKRGAEGEKLKTLKYPTSYSLVNLARTSNAASAHSCPPQASIQQGESSRTLQQVCCFKKERETPKKPGNILTYIPEDNNMTND